MQDRLITHHSAQTKPAPNSFAIKRNAGLQTPAIGASTTWFFILIEPICNKLSPPKFPPSLHL